MGLFVAVFVIAFFGAAARAEEPLVVAAVKPTSWTAPDLQADGGQVMQTYDISPFVEQAGPGSQKLVVDWVLQDTGYPAWHGTQLAAIAADEKALRCFHVPAMQERVADVVTRFTTDAASPHRFSVRVIGMGGPAWRGTAVSMLKPIPTATPGVQAWMLSREELAMFLARVGGRSDYRELPTGAVLAANGQPAAISGGRKRPYIQDVSIRPEVWPGWQTLQAEADEGLSLDVHPLLSKDGDSVEAVVRCRIDQIERMAPVVIGSPTPDRSRVQIEVPQLSSIRVGERFRWPSTHALVVGLGLVPWPVPEPGAGQGPTLFAGDAARRDVVVIVEPRLAARR
jgi:hypothetical protein